LTTEIPKAKLDKGAKYRSVLYDSTNNIVGICNYIVEGTEAEEDRASKFGYMPAW